MFKNVFPGKMDDAIRIQTAFQPFINPKNKNIIITEIKKNRRKIKQKNGANVINYKLALSLSILA